MKTAAKEMRGVAWMFFFMTIALATFASTSEWQIFWWFGIVFAIGGFLLALISMVLDQIKGEKNEHNLSST